MFIYRHMELITSEHTTQDCLHGGSFTRVAVVFLFSLSFPSLSLSVSHPLSKGKDLLLCHLLSRGKKNGEVMQLPSPSDNAGSKTNKPQIAQCLPVRYSLKVLRFIKNQKRAQFLMEFSFIQVQITDMTVLQMICFVKLCASR